MSLPHCEQVVRVSVRVKFRVTGTAPSTETRLALQVLQRLGSFLNCLSWKNSCSPAVKTNSIPQSMHFNILSWNSIEDVLPSPHPAHTSPQRHAHECAGSLLHPPHFNFGTTPGFGPTTSGMDVEYSRYLKLRSLRWFASRFPPQERDAGKERAALGSGGPRVLLVLLFPSFFPAALAC